MALRDARNHRKSTGKCYPDFDTLQSAWRQTMEGQQ